MESKKLNLWFVAPKMGALSEVWMYRQAGGMPKFCTQVLTIEHANPKSYPAENFAVSKIPAPSFWLRVKRKLAAEEVNLYLPNNRYMKWYEELYTQTQPDVMLCQYGTTAIGMSEISRAFEIPLVVHFHGFDITLLLKSNPSYLEKLKSNVCTWAACIVVANYQREILLELGVDDSKIHTIPCGVPTELFRRDKKSATDQCEFLSVGRLTAKKDPLSTIRAFDLCLKSAPDSKLSIIGDGDLMQDCRNLTVELGIENRVTFFGAKPSSFVREAMSKASVFVQHSITPETGDKEGWPVALAEAAASELPIVSTIHASIPQQVEEGVTGFLVPEGDWQAMGDRMAILASDVKMREIFGQASRTHISNWDSKKQISQLEDLLLSIANEDAT